MDYVINSVLNVPWVKALRLIVVAWAITGEGIGLALETVAVALRPFVLWTKTKEDDKYLEIVIYWLDAVGDLFSEVAFGRWRQVGKVYKRIKEDLGKPYKERRTE